jgi:ornithine cyclodeaminase/alanine dehydrogenase-like protein (mu-crystallin family)
VARREAELEFPAEPASQRLPTIQGVLALFDGRCGRLVALMDSARSPCFAPRRRPVSPRGCCRVHVRRPLRSSAAALQALAQVRAVACVREIRRVITIDADPSAAESLASRLRGDLGIDAAARAGQRGVPHESDIIITCTSSITPILGTPEVRPGTFVAAVGADNGEKSEIEPDLMRSADVVVDSLEQASAIGDLHHAIDAGAMTRDDVRGELGALLASSSRSAYDPRRVVIFDSTGVAVEDVAAAVLAFRRAGETGIGSSTQLF